jgi:hypothetical protein
MVGSTYAMEGSVLSFLKAEWKVSDTGSTHWASSLKDFAYFVIFCPWEGGSFSNKIAKKKERKLNKHFYNMHKTERNKKLKEDNNMYMYINLLNYRWM